MPQVSIEKDTFLNIGESKPTVKRPLLTVELTYIIFRGSVSLRFKSG